MPSIDRNERIRIMLRAEALDRRTHQPGQHGGVLKRTGLAVLRTLLFTFHNVASGRCDPGYDALARAAGMARSTLALALKRLEAAGLVVCTRRQVGMVRLTNAYAFAASDTIGAAGGATEAAAGARKSAWSGSRPQTTKKTIEQLKNAKTGPLPRDGHSGGGAPGTRSERMKVLFEVLAATERRLGLA